MSFTRIPNSIIDSEKLNPYQFQLFTIIVRKTDGWCKTEDGISLSQFEKMVTFSKNTIIKTLRELEEMGIIEITLHYDTVKKQHSYSTYKISQGVVHEVNKGSSPDEQGVVHEVNKQKKAITKETNTVKEKNKKEKILDYIDDVQLPDLNVKAFCEWIEYKKYKYEKAGVTKVVNMLTKYSFQEQQQIVDNSIMNNYQGLFPLKKNNTKADSRKSFNDLVDEVMSKGVIYDC